MHYICNMSIYSGYACIDICIMFSNQFTNMQYISVKHSVSTSGEDSWIDTGCKMCNIKSNNIYT